MTEQRKIWIPPYAENYFYVDENEEKARELLEKETTADPERDYFSEARSREPKKDVGEYVARQGISVPLITTQEEWEDAFDSGVAMIRSELAQDYAGMSGVLRSIVLDDDTLSPAGELRFKATPEYSSKLSELLKQGLRSGEISPTEFMRKFVWPHYMEPTYEDSNELGVSLPFSFYYTDTSLWRYIPGENIKVFRDPNIEGQYYFGNHRSDCVIDKSRHNKPVSLYGSKQEIVPAKIIELYEEIRALPRFDQRQIPLMEIQQDEKGELHFLQYLKTGLTDNIIDNFTLPQSKDAIRITNVRGVTGEDGVNQKLYIAPTRKTRQMEGQGFYFDETRPDRFSQQYFSIIGNTVLHAAYVSLKGSHFATAPFYRAQLAMGLTHKQPDQIEAKFKDLVMLVHGETVWDEGIEGSVYIDAKITSNGREAAIETDFEPKFEGNT